MASKQPEGNLVPLTPWRKINDTIECKGSKKALTTTFHLTDTCFAGKEDAFDFHIQAAGADATISFVRVIKIKRAK